MQPRLARHHCGPSTGTRNSPSIFHGCASSAPPLSPSSISSRTDFPAPALRWTPSLALFACGRKPLRGVLFWCASSLSASPLPCGPALPASAMCHPAYGQADVGAPVIDVAAPVAAHVRRTLPRTVKGLAVAQHGQRAAAAAAVSVQVVHERRAALRAHAGIQSAGGARSRCVAPEAPRRGRRSSCASSCARCSAASVAT